FPAFVGLAGSSPAFVLTFIEALARAGVLAGVPKAQAVDIVAQAVLGSALTVQAEAASRAGGGRTPADLVDAVCSPGGTTVAGLVAMERAGFSSAVIEGFRATVARDRELGA
ncbi:pyrroline-5-carboxylate reductase, partial [Actinomyces sp. 186855]